MTEPYLGEIKIFAGTFAPRGWALCDGQLLQIAQYDALFSLYGTTYGGDGATTFGLPDLRGRIPLHLGQGTGLSNYFLGQKAGVETVTLTNSQMPVHTHAARGAQVTGDQTSPAGALPANSVTITPYLNSSPDASFHPGAVGSAGGSQPHTNVGPFQCLNFIVALVGIYPSRS